MVAGGGMEGMVGAGRGMGGKVGGAWPAGCPGHSLVFHKSHAPESLILFSFPHLYFTGTRHIKMDSLYNSSMPG